MTTQKKNYLPVYLIEQDCEDLETWLLITKKADGNRGEYEARPFLEKRVAITVVQSEYPGCIVSVENGKLIKFIR